MRDFRVSLIVVLSLLLGLRSTSSADGATSPSPNDVFRSEQRIVTAGLASKSSGCFALAVSISGYQSVESTATIPFFCHGGPGMTSIPASYYYIAGWEEYFAVVLWDQRGAGKTYLANDRAEMRPTMTSDRMVADPEEFVSYLRKTYGRYRPDGPLLGTVLGVKVAHLHPDWFSAYVGISEFVDFEHSEGMGYQATLAAARADPNKQAVPELEAMAPFPDPRHPQRTLEHLEQERWLERYDGDTRTSLDNEVGQFRVSDFGRVRD